MTTELCSPMGFMRTPSEGTAELSWQDGRWFAAGRPLGRPLRPDDVAPLRPLRALRVAWPREPAAYALATIRDLAGAGVPLTADPPPAWVRAADPVLAALIAGWVPEAGDGSPRSVADLRREEHSVRLRRHALRAKGLCRDTPQVAVVMASRRPHLVGRALAQIARQRGADLEVIVALHGYPADLVRQALDEFPGTLTVIEADRDTPFGAVLNQAAERSSAGLIAKWDDDDWYGPEHIADLLLAKAYSGADVVGTAAEFFHLEPLNCTIRRTDYSSEVWTDHVAGGTILIDRRLFQEVGGFAPLPGGVDSHLLRAAAAAGGRIYRTHGLGYMLSRSVSGDHTWRLPLAHFLRVATNQWHGFRPSLLLETP
ncbi:MAG: glycosyltransferase [Thermobispora bispora]|nr:glycosyltransferase [Thermobispora bispora]